MRYSKEVRKIKIEIRNDTAIISGYVNGVGRDSRIIPSPKGGFIEQVVPKTFQKALEKGNNIEIRLNHARTLGSTEDGILTLGEDSIGLKATATITDAEVIEKARRKELRGWSFGFIPVKDSWEETDKGVQRRLLEDIILTEVTIVDNTKIPAYIATSIEVRGGEEYLVENRMNESEVEIREIETEVEEVEVIDYGIYEREVEILKLKRNGEK